MSSNTIKWYQDCQKNFKNSIDRKRIELESLKKELESDEKRYTFTEFQICEALRQGKDKFDNGRFCKQKTTQEEAKK